MPEHDEPSPAEEQCRQGELRLEAGDQEAALEAFDTVLRLDPRHARARFRRGQVYALPRTFMAVP